MAIIEHFVDENKRQPNFLKGKRVIDLGAGTGVLGIACAMLGADVLMTDSNVPGNEIHHISINSLSYDAD